MKITKPLNEGETYWVISEYNNEFWILLTVWDWQSDEEWENNTYNPNMFTSLEEAENHLKNKGIEHYVIEKFCEIIRK